MPSGLAEPSARIGSLALGGSRGHNSPVPSGGRRRLPQRDRERVHRPADRGVRAVHVAVQVRHTRAAAGGDADRKRAHAREKARHAAVRRSLVLGGWAQAGARQQSMPSWRGRRVEQV